MPAGWRDIDPWAFLFTLMLTVLLLNACVAALATVLRLNARPRVPDPGGDMPIAPLAHQPFVSVHVPAYDEPPEVLKATLTALSRLKYDRFEVIVLDNNTPDQRRWKPIEAHCRTLGSRFRFVHRDGVRGAKAGALNLALDLCDPRATLIAVVDADYQCLPDFLLAAADILHRTGSDYVQFPQAYRHSPDGLAVADELGDYFHANAHAANASSSMLLTGTLCVINRSQLVSAGGWPTSTITEDADLGLTLFQRGARGVFVNRVVGTGLLPVDLEGLLIQRRRWAAGNFQTLLRYTKGSAGDLAAPSRLGSTWSILSQLLAWPAFGALPVLALVVASAVRLLTDNQTSLPALELVAAWTIAGTFAAILLEVLVIKRKPAILHVKLALLWTSSTAWIPVLLGQKPKFRRTPKQAGPESWMPWQMQTGALVLLGCAVVMALCGASSSAIALLLPLASLPAARKVDAALRRSATTLFEGGENGCIA